MRRQLTPEQMEQARQAGLRGAEKRWGVIKERERIEPRRPACMSDVEWRDWSEGHAAIPWPKVRVLTPCFDCLPEFAVEMAAKDRCDGYPGQTGLEADTPQRRAWREAARRVKERRTAA